jgi:hypothetical protein
MQQFAERLCGGRMPLVAGVPHGNQPHGIQEDTVYG